MSITAAQLLVKVNADTAAAQAGLGGLMPMLGSGGLLGLGAAGAAAAVAGIGVASTKMAGDFQQNMTQLVTGAGESQSNIKMVSDGILQMAVDTGTSTKQLSDGMYMIESAGYHGKAGLDILKAAAEGAKVGNADLGTVADATTTILKDYPNVVGGASGAVNTLIATVASGKTHMSDLSASLAMVLPTASSAGIGLNDVMGAMATMTGEGVPAADAATYLRQTMIALSAPSKQAETALKSVGLSSSQVAAEMHKSLPDALKMITDAVGKKFPVGSAQYIAAIKDISGGSRQMQGMLDLTGQHMQDFQTNTNHVGDAAKKGGDKIAGWTLVQKDFNQHLAVAKEKAETLMIGLGQKLLPVATQFIDFLTTKALPALAGVVAGFQNLVGFIQSHQTVFTVLGIIVAGAMAGMIAFRIAALIPMIPTWYAQAAAAGAAAIATAAAMLPFIAIGVVIALLIAGIILLVTHWTQVTSLLGRFKDGVGKDVGDAFSGLGTIVHNVWTGIQTAVKGAINGVLGDINSFIRFIDGIQIHIPSVGVGPVQTPAFNWNGLGLGQIPYLAQGGDVAPGGAAIVGDAGMELLTVGTSGGARVTPLPGGRSSGAASGGAGGATTVLSSTFVIQLDGRTIAESTVRHLPGLIRNATGTRSM